MGRFSSKALSRQLVKRLSLHSTHLAGPSLDFVSKFPKSGGHPIPVVFPKSNFTYFAQEAGYPKRVVPCNYFIFRALHNRHVSQLAPSAGNEGKKVILVDTLALVRKLQAEGFTSSQAEAITSVMTYVLNECLESVAQSFVARSDLQKSDMTQQTALLKLKADVERSQEGRLTSIQHDAENLRSDVEKLRSEMRYEMEKVTADQRLDLNLERGRMRDELTKQSTEMANLTNKLNKEINALKTQLEASKFEVIKYCIGTIVSVIALGLGLLRIFK